MRLDLENLPADTALLHRLVRDMAAVVEHRDGEIERLHAIIKQLQRAQFGRRSERLDPDQLALGLEDPTATSVASKRAAHQQRRLTPSRWTRGYDASRCPTICRATMCGSISTT